MSFVVRDLMVDVFPETERHPLWMCLPMTNTGTDDEEEERPPECPDPSIEGPAEPEDPKVCAPLASLAELREQLRASLSA